jgi:hypothetical protein
LSLYFSDFFTNLYRFYKFAVFGKQKEKKTRLCTKAPGKIWGLAFQSFAGPEQVASAAASIPDKGRLAGSGERA